MEKKTRQKEKPSCRPASSYRLIILCFQLEIGFRVFANRADFWSEFANDDVPAITAFPNREIIANEDDASFDVFKKLFVTGFVMAFDFADHPEFGGDFLESFAFGDFSEARIHIGPFFVFAISGGF